MYGIQSLDGFNQNQTRDIFHFFHYEIINDVGGEKGVRGRMREVGGGEVNIGVPIRRYQVYVWCVAMQF